MSSAFVQAGATPVLPGIKVERHIQSGAFGAVWAGRVETTGAAVAIKVQTRHQHMLHHEASVLRILGPHSNIVRMVDIVADSKQAALALELCDGDLLDFISRHKRVPQACGLELFQQIVAAVHHCHSSGVHHCDIKPENVLLQGHSVRLTDFGASSVDGIFTARNLGSAQYLCPELLSWREGDRVDYAAGDVWALGVVLFTMLAGYQPWAQPTTTDIHFSQFLAGTLRMPSRLSTEARSLIMSMLQLDPKARPTVAQLLQQPLLVAAAARRGATQFPTAAPVKAVPSALVSSPKPMVPPVDTSMGLVDVTTVDVDMDLDMDATDESASTSDAADSRTDALSGTSGSTASGAFSDACKEMGATDGSMSITTSLPWPQYSPRAHEFEASPKHHAAACMTPASVAATSPSQHQQQQQQHHKRHHKHMSIAIPTTPKASPHSNSHVMDFCEDSDDEGASNHAAAAVTPMARPRQTPHSYQVMPATPGGGAGGGAGAGVAAAAQQYYVPAPCSLLTPQHHQRNRPTATPAGGDANDASAQLQHSLSCPAAWPGDLLDLASVAAAAPTVAR